MAANAVFFRYRTRQGNDKMRVDQQAGQIKRIQIILLSLEVLNVAQNRQCLVRPYVVRRTD